MTKKEIVNKYNQTHDELTKAYYVDQSLTKEEFDAQHGQCWTDMDAELRAGGFIITRLVAVCHWARVSAFNAGSEKPLEVKRTYKGEEFTVDCYVTQGVVDDYQAGKLAVGDFVIVEFVEGDLDKPLAVAKVYKSW